MTYDPGVSPLMDAFINHPAARARSTTCVATAGHMWRVDHLFGPEEALDRIESLFVDETKCNECHTGYCDTTRQYEVLEREPTYRIVYTHRQEIAGCHSIPHLAVEHVGSGALFQTERAGDCYEWTVLMPDDSGVGSLYDTISAELQDGITLDLGHVTGRNSWQTDATALAQLPQAQREAIAAAVDHGYYAIPRECTVSELSERLDIPRSTLQYRLQRAEATLLEGLVDQVR